jgi:putative DNA primase/helicase
VEWYGGDLRYVTAWDKFIAWDGQRWVHDDSAPMRFATDTARRMLTLAQDEQRRANEACAAAAAATGKPDVATAAAKKRADRRVKHAIDSQSAPRLQAMVRLSKSRPEFAIKHTALDADGLLLNVANGTIDLRTGELRPHERTDLITKLAPVAYDPSAECPVWDRFLSSSMAGKTSVIGFLQRAIGYALTGETREHVLGFCFGSGANGKTTFLATIHEMLGEYAKPAARSLLMKKRGDEHPTALADLYGARFVTCSEIAQDQAFDEALVKDLTGGDPISARRMREDFWSFTPTHKLFIAGNHRPRVEGDDDGIWRRIRTIPWVVTIPADQRDPTLRQKLVAELPGILAWAVRGCLDWQRDGLGEPIEVTQATAEYREESDPIGEFFALRCVFDANAKTARRVLRLAYEGFCAENGAKPLDAKAFASRLRARGVQDTSPIAAEGGRRLDAWRGIRLMTDAERDSTEGRGTSSDQSGLIPTGSVSVIDRTGIDPSPSLWSLRRASGGDAE